MGKRVIGSDAGSVRNQIQGNKRGVYGTKNVPLERDDLFRSNRFNLSDIVQYAVPFIGEAIGRKHLRIKHPRYTPAQLLTGTVRDLPKPDFKIPSRVPVGPDVQSQIGRELARDSIMKDRENEYYRQNAAFRLQQEENIRNARNQAEMFNKQMESRYDLAKSQFETMLAPHIYESVTSPFIALQQNLASRSFYDRYADAQSRTALAEHILSTYDVNTPEYKQALRYLGGKRGVVFPLKKSPRLSVKSMVSGK